MPKVHIVLKRVNSPYAEDGGDEIVKVFKSTRKRAAMKYADDQEAASGVGIFDYLYWVVSWEVK